jgi:AcrR family transcriptional regulator
MSRDRQRRSDPERREARKALLVDAAMTAVRAHGPGVSMDQIAGEAGVTKPILYRYFGDRGGLVLAIAERFMDELRTQLRAALALPTGDPQSVLVSCIDAHLALVQRDPDLYRFIVQRGTEAPGGPEKLQSFLNQVSAEVAVVLGDALRATRHDSGLAEPWAVGMVGMVHEVSLWWAERQSMSRPRLVDALATLLWSGLAYGIASPDVVTSLAAPHGVSPSDGIIHALEART